MAWVSKENIDSKKPLIKALCKEYGVKATLSGTNDHAMKLTVASGAIDFIDSFCSVVSEDYISHPDNIKELIEYTKKTGHIQVNHYHMHKYFNSNSLEFLQKAKDIMNQGNHDRSDIMSDYFDVGCYIDIYIGRWNKPYKFENKI